MKKRVSAALLSLFLTMGMIITPAKALNPTETYGDFQYEVRGEEIAITGYTGRSEQLVIPSEIQNKPVTIIAGSTFQKNVSQLKSIYFPKTLKDYSFGNICLEHLQSIYVAEENTVFRDLDGVLFTKDGTTLLRFPYGRENYAVPPNTTEIVSYAFSASLLKSVILPDTITTIPLGAFFGCSELEVIKFPSNLRKIASQAFNYCNQLKQIVLPDGLQTVGDHAFGECKQLQRLYIPEGVTLVANSFIGCSNLQNVMLERDVELGFHCFYGTPKDCNYYVWPDTEAERDLANMGFTNLYVLTAAQGDGAALLGLQDVNTPQYMLYREANGWPKLQKSVYGIRAIGAKAGNPIEYSNRISNTGIYPVRESIFTSPCILSEYSVGPFRLPNA